MKVKLIAMAAAAMLVFAGGAQATGVFEHEDPQLDELHARANQMAATLRHVAEKAGASRLQKGPRGRRGPRGAQGPRGVPGAQGATGPQGPAGTFGSIVSVTSPPAFLCSYESGSCAVGSARVDCPPGTTVTGGGYLGAGILTTVVYNAKSGNGWGVIGINFDEVPVTNMRAEAICAS